MIRGKYSEETRNSFRVALDADLAVVGGGMAGVCAAITAARAGIKVILVQDRPVLGGNASSEVRLWILGATSHMGNNNRWAREGGVIDEILLENLYRNKEGNALIFDTILLEKVTNEPSITLLLNTAVYNLEKSDSRTIKKLEAFCSQNSTEYIIKAPLFCDASGDGIVAFKSGAAFRMGAESKDEFGELFAPDKSYGELLGHSMYFYSKSGDKPVKYVAPDYALRDIKKIRYKLLNKDDHGCWLWWIEYGGRLDTVYDTEKIKWELWKVVYGIWDYIKNSGEIEDVDNLTLEWVATIPGKRESRRFEGHYLLRQQDVVEQTEFDDAVSFGGWSIDLHPADGVYSKLPGCNQFHSKGVYQIPYRCFISRDIKNLFYAGRIISATHVAFGSTRVMATCSHGGQVVGMAAAMCKEYQMTPKDLLANNKISELQQKLNIYGQSIPDIPIDISQSILSKAELIPSSQYALTHLPENGPWISLNKSFAQLLPLKAGVNYGFELLLRSKEKTEITCELRASKNAKNYTPEIILEQVQIPLHPGEQRVNFNFNRSLKEHKYGFITLLKNESVEVKGSNQRQSGILSVINKTNKAVSNNGTQIPPKGIGVDSFEFWTPERRPEGHNMAFKINPPIDGFNAENLLNGFTRPSSASNAWVADLSDPNPRIELRWKDIQKIHGLQLHFDSDFDHPLESSLLGHPETTVPFVVRDYKIRNCNEQIIYEKSENHQTINRIAFPVPVNTAGLKIELEHPSGDVPASLFHIHLM